MSEVLEKMKSRRSIRRFKPDTVPDEYLDKIVEAGLYAASAKGQQNTIIFKVTNKELRDKISRLNCEIGGWNEGFDPFYGAPAMLIVLARKDWPQRVYDGSLVMGNMMLAAHELGLGSCWIHRAREEFEMDWGKHLLAALGIKDPYEGIGHCAIGYIEGEYPEAAPRKADRVFSDADLSVQYFESMEYAAKGANLVGSYVFQGGETGYFTMNAYGEGDAIAEIEYIAPEGAEELILPDGAKGWRLKNGVEIDLRKHMMTRRLGNNIEPALKHPDLSGLMPIAYEVLEGSMELEEEWSFLDEFQ